MNELYVLLGLILVLMLYTMVAAAGAATKNSSHLRLQEMVEEHVALAALASQLAEDSSRLIISTRLSVGMLRLLGLALAVVLYDSLLVGELLVQGILLVLMAAWLFMGLLHFIAENVVLKAPASWAARLALVTAAYVTILTPIVWLVMQISGRIFKVYGKGTYPIVTEAHIMTMVDAGEEGGVIEKEEKAMIYSIFQLDDTLAREVMVPRIDLLSIDESTSIIAATDMLLETGHSRAPVYSGTIDHVIGVVYLKDLVGVWRKGDQEKLVSDFIREAYFVPEAMKLDDLLTEMQARQIQMAVVVDEYGGTAGLVTIEDIVEEIVGEIRDEYDFAEELPYQRTGEGEYLFQGGIDLDDVNNITDAGLPKDASDTLGGFIYSELGRVPSPGDTVEAGRLRMVVEQVSGRRIRKIRAKLLDSPQTKGGSEANGTSPGIT